MWPEIIYPFANFNCATVEVGAWNKWFHHTHYWDCDYISMFGLKLTHVIITGSSKQMHCLYSFICKFSISSIIHCLSSHLLLSTLCFSFVPVFIYLASFCNMHVSSICHYCYLFLYFIEFSSFISCILFFQMLHRALEVMIYLSFRHLIRLVYKKHIYMNVWVEMCTTHRLQLLMVTWWRHQMETFSALPDFCVGIIMRSFDMCFVLRLNKRLSKRSGRRWLETSRLAVVFAQSTEC